MIESKFNLNGVISPVFCIKNGCSEHQRKRNTLDVISLHDVKEQSINNFTFGTSVFTYLLQKSTN